MSDDGNRIPWRPPKWVSPFQCLRVQQGSEAMFVGQISGIPAPSVQWTWRGHPLEAGDRARAKTHYDEQTGRVCLVIPDLGPGDEGDYMCRADNPYGDSTCTITINPETVDNSKKKVVLPKGSCRMKLKACHIDSDDYADYASTVGL